LSIDFDLLSDEVRDATHELALLLLAIYPSERWDDIINDSGCSEVMRTLARMGLSVVMAVENQQRRERAEARDN